MALSACNTETDSAGRELTAHGTAAFPIACYHDDLEAAPVPWHWHEELELLLASEGWPLQPGKSTRWPRGTACSSMPGCCMPTGR